MQRQKMAPEKGDSAIWKTLVFSKLTRSEIETVLRNKEYLQMLKSETELPEQLNKVIFELLSSALRYGIELSSVETNYWLSYLMKRLGKDTGALLECTRKYQDCLNLNVIQYNTIMEGEISSWRLVAKQMAEFAIEPDRMTISMLIDEFAASMDTLSLLRLTAMIFDVVRVNIDTEMMEKLITAYSHCKQPDLALLMLMRVDKIYEKKQSSFRDENRSSIPLSDKLALDNLLTQLGGRPNGMTILNHSIRPTLKMVESLLRVCRIPNDKDIVTYLRKTIDSYSLDME
ncbi:hypothetical protein FOA43_004333 [Brettanomyces nanus]|uniref:Uncharacterized protein n=1 Tax=Eeniella nana TaxID=13502 RepID=A0A875SBP3_EENNA|nr:uncharacterized protein FOA43_004333 [Brettanomyces nanus]QPG76939.1 hypothetical protein FOA43_004333 [Brettanomyces nanus]